MATTPDKSFYTLSLEQSEERAEYVTNALVQYNKLRRSPLWANPPQPRASLEAYALDEAGTVIGGLVARTNEIPEWLEISIVWVAEERRGQGLGRALMMAAEEEAKMRGCRYARLGTAHYQAPDFYRKLGYTLYAQLQDCPQGDTVFDFYKAIR